MTTYAPNVKVEIAFTSGYTTPAASRTWTDVSQWVELAPGVSIARGRSDEFNIVDASTLSLTLDNTDGRFTAGKIGGAYYPNVKIGRPIRVTSKLDGVDYVRFTGYVDQWPVAWDGTDAYASAQITASSRMNRLAANATLRGLLEEEFDLGDADAWFPFDGTDLAVAAADKYGNENSFKIGGSGNAPSLGAETGLVYAGTGWNIASFGGDQFVYTKFETPLSTSAAGGVLVEMFINEAEQFGELLSFFTNPTHNLEAGGSPQLDLVYDGGGLSLSGTFTSTTGTLSFSSSAGSVDAGPHHIALHVVYNGGGNSTVTLYVDGVVADTETGVASAETFYLLRLSDDNSSGADATFSNLLINADLARVTNRAEVGLTGFAGDTASERIARYAAFALVPAVELDLDANTEPVDAIDTSGKTAIDAMREVEVTEGGVLFDAKDGDLTFRGRAARYNVTSSFTLSAVLQQIGADLSPKLDRSTLANDVSVTASDGTTARATNQASITEYGYVRTSVEVAAGTEFAFQAASWRVNTYGEPLPRIPAVTVNLLPLDDALIADLIEADIGTRFTLADLPNQAPAGTSDYFVEGYTENIGTASYSLSFNVSPTTGFDVWEIQDPVFGQYDAYPIAL